MSWQRTYRLGNKALRNWFGTPTITYTDTLARSESIHAIFDEAYQLVSTGDDGVDYTMTRPVLSVRYADFITTTLEADATVVIGARTFRVDGIERTGYEDARLILQEVTA